MLDRDRQPLGDEEIEGIFSRERRIQVLTRANPGRPPDPRGAIAGGLVVGINLLLDREVFLGDEVKVVTISPENKKPLMENFVVVGAFKSGEFEVDSRTALVRIEKLRDFLDLFDPGTGESLSEGVRVALDDFELVDGVRSLIFKALVDETVRTRLPEVLELIEEIAASFLDEKAMGDLIEEISPLWDDVQAPPPGELQSAFKKAAEDLASRDTLRKAREEIQLDWETLFTRFPNDLSQQGLLLGALHSTAAAWEETLGLGEAAGSPLERVVRGFLYRTAVGDLIVEGRELVYRLVPDSFTVQILTWKDRRTVLLQAVEREKSIVSFLVFLINAFIACLVLLMLLLMVIEKTRDIGVMIALGGTTRGVVSIFLCTGLTIVLVGIILGLVVGYYFVLNINTIHDTIHHLTGIQLFDPDIYKLDHLPTTLSVKQVLVSVAPAIGLGIFASLIPALWASRRDPIKAIHYE